MARRVKHYRIGSPHRKIRPNCKWCPRNRHNHTTSGNTHRFHGYGSFCATHSTTMIGRHYCTRTGASKRLAKKYPPARRGRVKRTRYIN